MTERQKEIIEKVRQSVIKYLNIYGEYEIHTFIIEKLNNKHIKLMLNTKNIHTGEIVSSTGYLFISPDGMICYHKVNVDSNDVRLAKQVYPSFYWGV